MPVSITSQKSNQASIAQSVDNYKLDGLEKPKIPFRNIVAVIGSFAASTMFAARCVLSVAIVAMVSSNSEIVSSNDDNSTVVETISFKVSSFVPLQYKAEADRLGEHSNYSSSRRIFEKLGNYVRDGV